MDDESYSERRKLTPWEILAAIVIGVVIVIFLLFVAVSVFKVLFLLFGAAVIIGGTWIASRRPAGMLWAFVGIALYIFALMMNRGPGAGLMALGGIVAWLVGVAVGYKTRNPPRRF